MNHALNCHLKPDAPEDHVHKMAQVFAISATMATLARSASSKDWTDYLEAAATSWTWVGRTGVCLILPGDGSGVAWSMAFLAHMRKRPRELGLAMRHILQAGKTRHDRQGEALDFLGATFPGAKPAEAIDLPEGWEPIPGSPESGHRRTDGAELWRWVPGGWYARTAGGARTAEGCETHTDALEALDRLDQAAALYKAERGAQ